MKILASDFDNTIYFADNEELNRRNVSAIRQFVEEGNYFCVITGRNYPSVKKRLDQYQIPYHYLICEDGAKLFRKNDECFFTTYLEEEDAKKVVEILQREKWNYTLDNGFGPIQTFQDCVKIAVDCEDKELKKQIVETIRSQVPIHVYASRKHVNIIEKSVNKKAALDFLLEYEGFNGNDLYVIGDNDNDYEMLKAFKGAVVKKHHPKLDELKKKEYNALFQYVEELMKH